MTNKIVKSVGFNVSNPDEYQMLKHVKRRNFSGYVKKLIAADLLVRGKSTAPEIIDVFPEPSATPERPQPVQPEPVAHIEPVAPVEPIVPKEKPAEVAPTQSSSDKLAQLKRGLNGPKLFN